MAMFLNLSNKNKLTGLGIKNGDYDKDMSIPVELDYSENSRRIRFLGNHRIVWDDTLGEFDGDRHALDIANGSYWYLNDNDFAMVTDEPMYSVDYGYSTQADRLIELVGGARFSETAVASNVFGDTWRSVNTLLMSPDNNFRIKHEHYDWRDDPTPSSTDYKSVSVNEAFDFIAGWHDEYGYRRSPEILNSKLKNTVDMIYAVDLSTRISNFISDIDRDAYNSVDAQDEAIKSMACDLYQNPEGFKEFIRNYENNDFVKHYSDYRDMLDTLLHEVSEYSEFSGDHSNISAYDVQNLIDNVKQSLPGNVLDDFEVDNNDNSKGGILKNMLKTVVDSGIPTMPGNDVKGGEIPDLSDDVKGDKALPGDVLDDDNDKALEPLGQITITDTIDPKPSTDALIDDYDSVSIAILNIPKGTSAGLGFKYSKDVSIPVSVSTEDPNRISIIGSYGLSKSCGSVTQTDYLLDGDVLTGVPDGCSIDLLKVLCKESDRDKGISLPIEGTKYPMPPQLTEAKEHAVRELRQNNGSDEPSAKSLEPCLV